MKNQNERRNFNRNRRDERGRYTDNHDVNYGNSRSNHYQDRSEDYSQDYYRNRSYQDRENSLRRNSGSDFQDEKPWYASRRGENYGFGSQENNESYRDFSTQGRNSGLGNQGGYSSYDQDTTGKNWDRYPNYGNLSDYDSNDNGRISHRGKGPKGYQRSDERIREIINDALTDDDQLDASEIEVHVEGGEVTLSGHISQREDKRRAEEIAESVSGVKNVENKLRIPARKDSTESKSESRSAEQNGSEKSKNRQTNHVHA